jgi:hypothetical protein
MIDEGRQPKKNFLVCINYAIDKVIQEEIKQHEERMNQLRKLQEKFNVEGIKCMSCKCASFDEDEGRYYCEVSGSQCMYLFPNSGQCAKDFGEGPDAEVKNNTENGLRVFSDGDSNWYASPFEEEEFIKWFKENIDNTLAYDEYCFDECDLDDDGMWYETNDPKDIEKLGDYDEQCNGGFGDLRKDKEDHEIVEKFMTFREVIKLQGESKEPYCIATTNY